MIPAAHFAVLHPAAMGWLLLLLAAGWIFLVSEDSAKPAAPGWKWWLLVGTILLTFRWPLFWVAHQQNPDESQLIAGALTLRHDPVFWRSVDGGTAGPLDYYPLLPAAWGDGAASYAIARFIGLVVVFGTIALAGETVALIAGGAIARAVALPAIAFYAFTTNPDFNHYSTELMPAFLLAAAGYAAARQVKTPRPGWLWLAALLLGGVPWAKLQAIPLALALWAIVAVREIRHQRSGSLVPLIAGFLLPAVACFGMAALTGQTEDLIVPFFLHNLAYINAPQYSWIGVATQQWQNALLDGYLGVWLAGTALFAASAVGWGMRRASSSVRQGALVAALLLVAGLVSALGPRRPSTHHLHLIMVPTIWLAGASLPFAVAAKVGKNRWLVAAGLFALCCLAPQLAWRAFGGDPFVAINTAGVSEERRQLARAVRMLAEPAEPIGMWGWRCSLYVEASRPQATRQAQTEGQIYESALQPYFLRRYLADFQATNPPVFADAVGPGNFAFEAPRFAHESFGPLRELIRARYTQVALLDGTRLYVRNDRLARWKGALPPAPPR